MYKSEEKNIFLGITTALGAFLFWGIAPIYWKQVQIVSSTELLAHRIVWGFLILGIYLLFRKGFREILHILKSADRWLILSSLLIFTNWFLFVWAVNNGMIVDASLGYFLNPILNILAGYFFFNEGMGLLKAQAVFLAGLGVGFLFAMNSGNPLVSIALASTFCSYAILKKKSSLTADSALFFEFSFWFIPCLVYCVFLLKEGNLQFLDFGIKGQIYLILAGLVTIFPLWLYNTAVKNLDLGSVGFINYITPTIQLLLGVLIYDEFFDNNRAIAFVLIWLGILIYTVDNIRSRNRKLS